MPDYLKRVAELYLKPIRSQIHRKSLGQHTLNDRKILERISQFASSEDVIIEIGGGEGNLTELLSSRSRFIITFEIDQRYVSEISKKIIKGIIVLADFLEVNLHKLYDYITQHQQVFIKGVKEEELKDLLYHKKFKIISNIPFNISSHLIHKLILESFFVESVHILIQKEFAKKLVAQPGSDLYSAISSLTQFFYRIKIEFDIPPWKFTPKPKVWGSFISLYPKSENLELFSAQSINQSITAIAKFINFTYEIFRGRKKLYCNKRVYKMSPEEIFENATGKKIIKP